MTKVKIYDLNNFTNLGYEINALIVGKGKTILTDNEACHTIHNLNGSIDFINNVSVPIKTIIESTPLAEEELGTWVRTFGSRIENNYDGLLKSIKEIGLDPKDYPRKVK
jgi:hypothetical protein